MAHFARTRVNLAAWAIGTEVTNVEFDDIDGKTFAAINGDGGGTWAPAAPIIIGGSGVDFTADVDFSAAELKGTATVGAGHFQVVGGGGGGDVLFDGTAGAYDVCFQDGVDVRIRGAGSDLVLGDGVNAHTTMVSALANFSLAAGSIATFNGTVTLNGTTQSLITPMASSSDGHVGKRVVLDADIGGGAPGHDANNVCGVVAGGGAVAIGDIIKIVNGDLSADRVYTVSVVNAVKGDVIEFSTSEPNWKVTVLGVDLKFVATEYMACSFVFDGAAWLHLSRSPFDA